MIQVILLDINYLFVHIKMVWSKNSFIWPIDRTQTGTTTDDRRGPVSNGNKGRDQIPQSFGIGFSPMDAV